MRGFAFTPPGDLFRCLQFSQLGTKRRRRGIDGKVWVINTSQLLGSRMYVHELHLRLGNFEQAVAL